MRYTCKYLNLLNGIVCSMSITFDVTTTLICLLIIVCSVIIDFLCYICNRNLVVHELAFQASSRTDCECIE